MIFECEIVTNLVLQWQTSKDPELMRMIIEQSTGLIEAIVSGYDSLDRDDLIQEACFKVQYALPYFNPGISNLHNYLTTVIKNMCNTYASKADREYLLDDRLPADDDGESAVEYIADMNTVVVNTSDDEALTNIIIRNRVRFPSIPVSLLDDVTEHIYYALRDGAGSHKQIVTEMDTKFMMDKALLVTIYQSTVIYMRYKNLSFAKPVKGKPDEFSLLEDLHQFLGDGQFSRFMITFAGTTLRIPSC